MDQTESLPSNPMQAIEIVIPKKKQNHPNGLETDDHKVCSSGTCSGLHLASDIIHPSGTPPLSGKTHTRFERGWSGRRSLPGWPVHRPALQRPQHQPRGGHDGGPQPSEVVQPGGVDGAALLGGWPFPLPRPPSATRSRPAQPHLPATSPCPPTVFFTTPGGGGPTPGHGLVSRPGSKTPIFRSPTTPDAAGGGGGSYPKSSQ